MQRSETPNGVVFFIVEILMLALRGWTLMLLLGALSQPGHLDIPELAIGFWTSVLVALAAGNLFNQISARESYAWTKIIERGY